MVPASVSVHAGRVRLVSVLGSWTLAATLPVDVNHPESQGSLWLEAGSLFAVWLGVPSLGPSLPLFPPPCLRWGWACLQPASSSLELLSPFVLQMAGSVFGWLIFSLSCYPIV